MKNFGGRLKVYAMAASLYAVALVLACCDDGLISDPSEVIFPDSNVSYRDHVQPFFNVTCNFSGCHNEQSRAGNLALTSHFDATLRPGMVLPGKPDQSVLVQIIQGKLPHPASFQARVNDNHKQGIATWVAEGAKSN